MNTILALGEILWDVLPEKIILGGAPFNFAVRINSLGDNGLFVSSLGTDELGDKAFEQVRSLGVDTSLLQRSKKFPTGTVNVSFDAKHLPEYIINPDAAYDHIELTDALFAAAAQAGCLCFGTLIQRATKSRQTVHSLIDAAPNAIKFLDINLRRNCYAKDTILYSLSKAHILKLNDAEVMQLCGILGFTFESFPKFCRQMNRDFDLDYTLVTFGEFGAFAQSTLGEEVYVPGYKVHLADSLGAGDAFSAAFVHHLLNGHSLRAACENGNALGALVATTHGGTEPVSETEIFTFLQKNTEQRIHREFA